MTKASYNPIIDPDKGLMFCKPELPKKFVPFPVELLPEPLRSLAVEGAEAMQCDTVLIVLPMLATVGAAIGNARRLVLKGGWSASSCLWTMFIAESGSVKTPAFRLAKKPLEEIERNVNQRFDEEDRKYQAELLRFESAKKAFDKSKTGEPPFPPAPPIAERFIVKDTTLPALVEILRDNPRGLLVPTDELAGWFGSFNKYDKGGGDAQQWLSIYSGESISVDRKGNRNQSNVMRPIKVYSPFVSITGAIQPGLWLSVLGAEQQASGMAARFMMAWPPRRAKVWTDAEVSESTLIAYAELIQSLVNLESEVSEGGFYKPKHIGMDHQAKKLFKSFFNSHNITHLDRHNSLAAASSKIEEIPARLALIIHNARLATGDINKDQIDAETMRVSIAIANWFMAEADRIYGIMAGEAGSQRDRELVDWIRVKGGSVTARDLAKSSRKYSDATEAEQHLNSLAQMGWGSWEPVKPGAFGGRPTHKFTLVTVGETPSKTEEVEGFADSAGLDGMEMRDRGSLEDEPASLSKSQSCRRNPEEHGENGGFADADDDDEIEEIF